MLLEANEAAARTVHSLCAWMQVGTVLSLREEEIEYQ
jgi:hypothetical protein